MDKLKGSMDVLNAMQLTAEMEGLDAQSKTLLRSKEVLAVILQGVVAEYQGYSRREIMDFIEADSIVDGKEVSPGRTNSLIQGDSAEFVQLNEKTSNFDLAFRAKNPLLSTEDVLVSLHVDVEPQKTYRPGYPIEKRGLYYLARSLSSQLSLATETTDYGQLEKCYSIWICRDDIPKEDSENEELWMEEPHMFSLSQCIYEDGLGKGIEKGMEQGIEALIRNNIMEGIPKERTIANMRKFFGLTEEKAEEYFAMAAEKEKNREFI